MMTLTTLTQHIYNGSRLKQRDDETYQESTTIMKISFNNLSLLLGRGLTVNTQLLYEALTDISRKQITQTSCLTFYNETWNKLSLIYGYGAPESWL